MSEKTSLSEARKKLEYYCNYQERCHQEVVRKCHESGLTSKEIDLVIVHLIENNYLNEERFACEFAIGKFHQKKWGRTRIKAELQLKNISKHLINKALSSIENNEYEAVFDELSQKHWNSISEKNTLKKRKKFCDFLLRKGWESDWVYEKVKELEKQ